jgi:ubiquinone biosynthesis protein COQ9
MMRNRFALAGKRRLQELLLDRRLHVEDMAGVFEHGNAALIEDAEVVDQQVARMAYRTPSNSLWSTHLSTAGCSELWRWAGSSLDSASATCAGKRALGLSY